MPTKTTKPLVHHRVLGIVGGGRNGVQWRIANNACRSPDVQQVHAPWVSDSSSGDPAHTVVSGAKSAQPGGVRPAAFHVAVSDVFNRRRCA